MKKRFHSRLARRNPMGAWGQMHRSAGALEQGLAEFNQGKLSGSELLGKAMVSALAKSRVHGQLRLDQKFAIENDAAFNERLFKFLRSRKKKAFSFAIVDMDYLRRINKKQGHDVADKALELLAEKLVGIARKSGGFAGRFGGDEFKVFAPVPGRALAGSLNLALGEMKGKGFSFSAGVASPSLQGLVSAKPQEIVEAINRSAEQALLRGKRAGRARIATGFMKKQ